MFFYIIFCAFFYFVRRGQWLHVIQYLYSFCTVLQAICYIETRGKWPQLISLYLPVWKSMKSGSEKFEEGTNIIITFVVIISINIITIIIIKINEKGIREVCIGWRGDEESLKGSSCCQKMKITKKAPKSCRKRWCAIL